MDCAEESTLYTQNPPAVQRRSSRALPSRPPARQFQTTPIYDTRAMADEAVQAPETRRLAKGPQSLSPYQPSRRPRTLSGFISTLTPPRFLQVRNRPCVVRFAQKSIEESRRLIRFYYDSHSLSLSLLPVCVPLLSEDHPPLRALSSLLSVCVSPSKGHSTFLQCIHSNFDRGFATSSKESYVRHASQL